MSGWRGVGLGSTQEQRQADQFFRDLSGAAPRRRLNRGVDAGQQELVEQAPAACPLPKRSAVAYFFKSTDYLRYNITSDLVDVGPAKVAKFWRMPSGFQSGLDAAVNWGDGHAYFFKGPKYVRLNIATDRIDVGPTDISTYWTHLPQEFQSNLDAVVNWGNGFAYFFKRDRYLRYNIATDLVDVGPEAIARFWPELPAAFQSGLDAVVNWDDGHAYFFKGDRYLRYDMQTKLVDVGPTEISRYWRNLPTAFQSGIKAAVNWTDPCDLAALMRAAGVSVTEHQGWRTRSSNGEQGCFTPVGIIVHHTTGTVAANVLAGIVSNVSANFFVDKSGVLTVVAGGRANHAGDGAQQVLDEVNRGVAPTDTALNRGLPKDRIGNGHFYGFENFNAGNGSDPWPEVQLDAIAKGCAALCQRHGWSANRVIGHKEWSRGKPVDPTFDMNAFRARVASHF